MPGPDSSTDDRTPSPDETTNFVPPDRRSAKESEETTSFNRRAERAERASGSLGSKDTAGYGPDESEPSLGTIGSCELLQEISRGGMGIVYRARQRNLDRVVALKIILDASFSTAEQVLRFHAEAQAAANLDHPNIVAIYELGEHEGRPYLVMEYIEGVSLSTWRDLQASRDECRIAELMKSIALAVDHAHAHGVIHRDLKPSNVLVDRQGHPHVVDFGLAKLITHDSRLTTTGVVLGTPSYMAPEQASGDSTRIGPAVDIYGMGAILYELLSGRPPFRADTIGATLAQVETDLPVPPRLLDASVSRNLEAICLKCLAKNPADRYASARALADDLDRILQGGRVLATRRIGVLSSVLRPMLIAGLVGGLAGLGVGTFRGVPGRLTTVVGALGATGSGLLCVAMIAVWNELLLPTWLLSRSSHPLAKTAFGLGLVLTFLLFYYPSTFLWEVPLDEVYEPGSLLSGVVGAVIKVGVLAGLVGKLFCLAAAFHRPAQGPLLWSITADLTGITFSWGQSGFVRLGSTPFPIIPWLSLFGVVCFVLAMERMARGLEEPKIEKRARTLRLWIAIVCPGIFAVSYVGHFVAPWMDIGFGILYLLTWIVGLVGFARVIHGLQARILQRI